MTAVEGQQPQQSGWARVRGAYDRFFFAEEPVSNVVAYRIFLSVWSIAYWIPRYEHAWELYCRPVLRYVHKVIKWTGYPVPPEWLAKVLLVATILCVIGVAFSRAPRWFHVLLFVPMLPLYALDTMMPRAYGAIALIQWCLLFMAPYDRLYDDDGSVRRAPRFGARLLMLQFASVYFYTVPAKLFGGGGWLDGSVLYWTFHGTRYGDFLFTDWFYWPMWICNIMSVGTLALELVVAFGLWFRKTRTVAMLALVFLHVNMMLFLRVSPLFHTLMIGHIILWLSPATIERVLARLPAFLRPR